MKTKQTFKNKSLEPRAPDFKSFDGYAAWTGITKNNIEYIKVVDSRTNETVCILMKN